MEDKRKELEALLKWYLEKENPRQMEEAWEKRDCIKACNLSKARQSAYDLLCVLREA